MYWCSTKPEHSSTSMEVTSHGLSLIATHTHTHNTRWERQLHRVCSYSYAHTKSFDHSGMELSWITLIGCAVFDWAIILADVFLLFCILTVTGCEECQTPLLVHLLKQHTRWSITGAELSKLGPCPMSYSGEEEEKAENCEHHLYQRSLSMIDFNSLLSFSTIEIICIFPARAAAFKETSLHRNLQSLVYTIQIPKLRNLSMAWSPNQCWHSLQKRVFCMITVVSLVNVRVKTHFTVQGTSCRCMVNITQKTATLKVLLVCTLLQYRRILPSMCM